MGGTSSTHVANAYRRPIYVRADAERKYLTEDSSSYSGGVEGRCFYLNIVFVAVHFIYYHCHGVG